jgi:ubiquinone/menaquinone biosynthesis C-methylase UbiE
MATVFMKWLETRPRLYERGIRLLTLGRLSRLEGEIVERFIHPGMHILELGCGPGVLAVQMAKVGAKVTAIDIAPIMLAQAQGRAEGEGVSGDIEFKRMDVMRIGEHFPPDTFDAIVASLVMSELPSEEMQWVLASCRRILKPDGRLLIIDEVVPRSLVGKLWFSFVRIPLVAITWLLTRTSTQPLRNEGESFSQAGYNYVTQSSFLFETLRLYVLRHSEEQEIVYDSFAIERLHYRVSLSTILVDLWALFFRIIPPYPRVRPGLYAIGQPDETSPVLMTGNFEITVRRLLHSLDGHLDAWLLVVDTKGINVWCASGGGFLTAEKVIASMQANKIERLVGHRNLILPQLCAVGVNGQQLREATGWEIWWGPILAQDIPDYIEAGSKKTDAMRLMRFPLLKRLEMVSGTLGFYGLVLLVPIAIFCHHLLLPTAMGLVAVSYFYALIMPWIPGRDGLVKSFPLAIIVVLGMLAYSFLFDQITIENLFNRSIGMVAISVFVAAEFQGMSPLMRGEQANWGWEVVIAVILGLSYWLIPPLVGWR